MLDFGGEVDALALGIEATLRRVEILDQIGGHLRLLVVDLLGLDHSAAQLEQRGHIVHVVLLGESSDERIVAQAQLGERHLDELYGQSREPVVMQRQAAQPVELGDARGQVADLIVAQVEHGQITQLRAQLVGHAAYPIAAQVEHLELVQLLVALGQRDNLVAAQVDLLERVHVKHLMRHGGELIAAQVDHAQAGELGQLLGQRVRVAEQVLLEYEVLERDELAHALVDNAELVARQVECVETLEEH